MSSSTSSLSSLSSSSSGYLKPKVALIGSGGLLGDATLTAFLSPEFSDYFEKPIRVLTRNIAQPFPANATFIRVDWNDDNVEDHLTRCLRGVSVVVNLLGYNPDAWDVITRAVCRVKPQLYIPPEFSFDHTLWDPRRIPMASVVDDKRRQTQRARAAGVRTVQIFCGIIMENIISGPHTGVDFLPSRRRIMALTSDNGVEHPVSFTSSWDVGKAIAAVSTMPAAVTHGDLDQVHISGDISSWSKLAKLMSAQLHPMSSSSFESQLLNHTSPVEYFLRIAAAEGQLHFPSSQSSRSRRAVPTNQNSLVDTRSLGAQPWVKLAQVVRHFDKHDNDASRQSGTSSPEESSKATASTTKKRKRASDSAGSSVEIDNNTLQSYNEDPKSRGSLENITDAKIPPALLPKVRTSKPRSSTAAVRRSARLATTTRESAAVLDRRVTRSMTKRANNNKTKNINQNTRKNEDKNNTKAAAPTGRSSQRRRVG
ncbi:hypothetical protein TWF225_005726 [Orbilia oligospora]|nr:hypothetical protein TWF225_005726 [Orbilia oligospora]KAF3253908.1 hypothetical protein TWF217_007373 [Orbilia oligospora]KAF3261251.1 hypothetical protein TWF128_003044 [Orbilia oligospora]KAF3293901.1 hypothetical protein TWF132_003795 [Orbilia oligospora]